MIVNISEAKANLSKLIEMVYNGESVTIAKNNLPIVDLVKHEPKGKRELGLAKGKLKFQKELIGEDEDIVKMFYGEQGEDHS